MSTTSGPFLRYRRVEGPRILFLVPFIISTQLKAPTFARSDVGRRYEERGRRRGRKARKERIGNDEVFCIAVLRTVDGAKVQRNFIPLRLLSCGKAARGSLETYDSAVLRTDKNPEYGRASRDKLPRSTVEYNNMLNRIK